MVISDIQGKTDREILIMLYDQMVTVNVAQERLQDKFSDFEKEQTELHETIYGNGKIGLQESQRDLRHEFDTAKKVASWIGVTFGALLVGMLFKIFTGEWSIAIK